MGNDAKKTELAPGTLEMLILKAIERNAGPMRGYGIARYVKQISGDVLQVEEGSLYPIAATPGDQRLGQSGVGIIRQQPSRPPVQVNARRAEAAQAGGRRLRACAGGDPARGAAVVS